MPFTLRSQRELDKQNAGQEDVYQYDDLPITFRVQIDQLLVDAIGKWGDYNDSLTRKIWNAIFSVFIREKGVYSLGHPEDNPQVQCSTFLQNYPTSDVIDLIDLSFKYLGYLDRNPPAIYADSTPIREFRNIVEELNLRFRRHGIGYEFAGEEIVRVDSQFVHSEAVKPAIQLMHGAGNLFQVPLQEFMESHRKYRHGEYRDAIATAGRAFESVLKATCTERR